MSIVPPLHEETIGLSDTVAEQVVITPVASNEEDLGDVSDGDIKLGDTCNTVVGAIGVVDTSFFEQRVLSVKHEDVSPATTSVSEQKDEPLPWEDLDEEDTDMGVEPEHVGDLEARDADLDDIGDLDIIGEDDVVEVDADDGADLAEAALPESEE